MKTFETWLPVFPGFYGTHFELDTENYIYSENQERRHDKRPEINYNHLDIDYPGWQERISELATEFIESILTELKIVSSIRYQSVSSPKYYNFSNDSINIEVVMSAENINNLAKYLQDHSKQLDKYLKDNYTGRSGFIPYHSNELSDWSEETNNFTEFNDKHKLGAVLQFIIENEQCTQYDESGAYMQMVYYCLDHCSEYEFISIKDPEGAILLNEIAGRDFLPGYINFEAAGTIQSSKDKEIFIQLFQAINTDDIELIEWDQDIKASEFFKYCLTRYHNFILTPEESDNNLKLQLNTSERV